VNYQSLPVNRPKNEVNTYHRDGVGRFDGNGERRDNYEPNSFGGATQDKTYREPPLKISGDADRYDANSGNDEFTQAGDLYRLFKSDERERMTSVIAGTMKGVPEEILIPNLKHFYKCDPEYGTKIAEKVGLAHKLKG
jgi:catalase